LFRSGISTQTQCNDELCNKRQSITDMQECSRTLDRRIKKEADSRKYFV